MLDAKSATTLERLVVALHGFVAGWIESVAGMKEIGYSCTRWNGRIVPSRLRIREKSDTKAAKVVNHHILFSSLESRISSPPHREMVDTRTI
jgi:hypothetical protein